MGRSLFGQAFAPKAPVVHVASADESDALPAYPPYRRWTPGATWDPDADEWFDAPNAVYEAFLTPAQAAAAARAAQAGIAGLAAEDEEQEEGSEGVTSGRATPMAVGEDPARMVAEALAPAERLQEAVEEAMLLAPSAAAAADPLPEPVAPVSIPASLTASLTARLQPAPSNLYALPADATPRVLGINAWSLESLANIRSSMRTPPPALAPSVAPVTPSTPLTLAAASPLTTPHILSWHHVGTSPPIREGPLSNASARRSLSHIAPMSLRA